MAYVSATSALGASAVTCTTPVNAGRPVAGSSRWCAARPSPSSQLRRPMPLVATPPCATSKACRMLVSNGLCTLTCRGARRAPPIARSPAQLIAKLSCAASSSASTSAKRPLARPPESSLTPGGRVTLGARASASTWRQREPRRAAAAARGGASASASFKGSGRRRSRTYPLSSISCSSVPSTSPPVLIAASTTASARRAISGLTATVRRGLALSSESSLSARKRENWLCHRSSRRCASSTAACDDRCGESPCTSTSHEEPKHSNDRIASMPALMTAKS